MEDCEPPPSSNPNADDGLLPIPSLSHDMLTADFPFPDDFSGAGIGTGDGDDFPFDVDFDFTVDDFFFADELLLNDPGTDPPRSDLSQERSPNSDEDRSPEAVRVYDCSSPEPNRQQISTDESNFGEKSSCPSPEAGSCKSNSAVSQDSGNNSDRDVSSSSFLNNCSRNNENSCESGDSKRKVKVEDKLGIKCMSKRKKEQEQEQGESSGEARTSKFRRSSSMAVSESTNFNAGSDEDEKRKARLMRNRESAQLSRQRKKQYVEELEDKVRSMHSTISELNSKIMYVMSENAALRQQLTGGAGVCPPPGPPPGMYPMAPMPYPWMPCPPYILKPQGSQVPLVPIPRLKAQQSAPAPKVSKKSESRKSEGKTKKVASISLLGLLFFFLLFGGLVPMVNLRYGGVGDRFGDAQKGAVLMVDKHGDKVGYGGGIGVSDGKFIHGRSLHQTNSSDGVGSMGNSSEPLVASLYVPRNDKLVKIDGNLIIHSVLASERAMASHKAGELKTSEETSLAIPRNYQPYPIPEAGRNNGRHPGNPNGRQRALGAGSSDELKPAGSDGKLQQWFREGHTGPMLSSGICTEVFQFDVSPHPGAIVPVTSIANTTSKHRRNSTRLNKPRNRRILHGEPIPFDTHTLNVTKGHSQPHDESDGLQSNKTSSSMVVSVLVDPREAGDGDGESVIRSKASRIFVVVLVDSVKYVTYSCMLPFVGSGTHLVTT